MKLLKVPVFVASLFGLGLLAGLDTPAVQADYVFGTPTVITTDFVTAPSVSTDGLSLYVDSSILGGYGDWDIYVFTRETIHDDWSAPKNLGPTINTWYADGNPDISADGRTLFFNSSRQPGGQGDGDIWVSTRATINDDWSAPVNLGPPINSPYYDGHPSISEDGLTLFFCSDRPGGSGDRDIWVSTRATINDPWGEPQNLGSPVNSPSREFGPDISSDGRTLFFNSERPGGYGLQDIWVTRRTTTEDLWGKPENLGPIVNDYHHNYTSCISADGSMLYWWSQDGRLRQVPIIPVVDFSKDGKVNYLDVSLLMLSWGTSGSVCDIGPTPLGDGIVDSKDLIALADHITEGGVPLCGDVNYDGVVDLLDLAELSKNWLQNGGQ